MSNRLYLAAGLALILVGCAPPQVIVKTVTKKCPPRLPEVSCPKFPDRGPSLREFLKDWESAKEVDRCKTKALESFQDSHRKCR